MSTLLQTAVLTNDFWYEQGASSKLYKAVDVTLTLTGQGNYANPIPPAQFGRTTITQARNARDSNNNIIPAAASYDQTTLLLGGPTSGATKNITATGLASAGNITATGVLATDKLLSAINLTGSAALNTSFFTPGAGVIAQASGAGDLHTDTILFILQAAAATAPGLTATVRLIVVGNE